MRATLRQSTHSASSRRHGFTIVELLIVIVVIAILAAITIVAYNGIQTRARASQASTALSQAKRKLELYKVDYSGYPTTGNLATAGVTDRDTTYQYTSDGITYCLTATAATVSYYLNSTTQIIPVSGGCAGHGQGGVAAITNLATDPRATTTTMPSGKSGWNTQRWFGAGGAGTHTLVTAAADGPVGISTYLRKTWTTPSTGTGALGLDNTLASSVTDGATTLDGIPIAPNTTYTFSSYMRASITQNSTASIIVWWHDASGVYLSKTNPAKVSLPAGVWVRVSSTLTSPATATSAGVVSDLNGQLPVAGLTIDGTGFMVTEGSALYNYVDPVINTNWIWNGTPNASTSTGPAL